MALRYKLLTILLIIPVLLCGCRNNSTETKEKFTKDQRYQYKNNKYFLDESEYLCQWDNDMTTYTQIIKVPIISYIMHNNFIYYNTKSDKTIWKADLDGTHNEQISTDEYEWNEYAGVYGYQDYIFFANKSGSIYSLNLKSNQFMQITIDEVTKYYIMNNKIYYENSSADGAMCRCDIDGTNAEIILEGENYWSFEYSDKDIIIYNWKNELYCIPQNIDDYSIDYFHDINLEGSFNDIIKDENNHDKLFIATSDVPYSEDSTFNLYSYSKTNNTYETMFENKKGIFEFIKDKTLYMYKEDKYWKAELNGLNSQEISSTEFDKLGSYYKVIED